LASMRMFACLRLAAAISRHSPKLQMRHTDTTPSQTKASGANGKSQHQNILRSVPFRNKRKTGTSAPASQPPNKQNNNDAILCCRDSATSTFLFELMSTFRTSTLCFDGRWWNDTDKTSSEFTGQEAARL